MTYKGWDDPELIKFMRAVGGIGKSSKDSTKTKKPLERKRRKGEDLTVDGYISKYGGIRSNVDDKVYTSKKEYMTHIKQSGHVIKDW